MKEEIEENMRQDEENRERLQRDKDELRKEMDEQLAQGRKEFTEQLHQINDRIRQDAQNLAMLKAQYSHDLSIQKLQHQLQQEQTERRWIEDQLDRKCSVM